MTQKNRLLMSIGLSIISIAGLWWFVDWGILKNVESRLRPLYLLPFCATIILIILATAYRWFQMLNCELSFNHAVAAALVGVGGNMILPLRGGDILRAYHSSRGTQMTLHKTMSRMMLEKVLDLTIACAVGCVGVVWLASTPDAERSRNLWALAGPVFVGVTLLVLLALYGVANIETKLLPALRRVRGGAFLKTHLASLFAELRSGSSLRALRLPLVLTIGMWLGLYAFAYFLIGRFVNIELNYAEVLVMMLAATIGTAMPAAPSGVGTLHASLISGYVFIGRDASEGLLYAIALHAAFFITFVLSAACILPFVHHPARATASKIYD